MLRPLGGGATIRRLPTTRGGECAKLRRLAIGGGEGEGGGGEAGLRWALSAPSISPGSRNTPSPNNSQGGSLVHFFNLVHHKATRSESEWKSTSNAGKHDLHPQRKQNSIPHRHVMWLHPWFRSTIA